MDFLEILQQGWRTIVLVFLLVTSLVTAYVLLTPPRFEAESRLMVLIGREYVYRPEIGEDTPRAPSLSEIVNSEVEILSGRDLAEEVVRSVGVEVLYPDLLEELGDPEVATLRAVPKLRQEVSIRPVLESSVIKVGFIHPVPEVAARAVNLLVERFEDKHLEVFGEERSDSLEQQLAQRQAKLQEAEEVLAAFKAGNGVVDLAEQRRLLLGRRMSLEEELRASELELAALPALPAPDDPALAPVELPSHLSPGMTEELLRQRHELEQELRGVGPDFTNDLVNEAALRLLDLELQETELLRDYSEESRKVRAVRAELERVRQFLADAERKASFAGLEEHAAQNEDLPGRIARLDKEIELLVLEERRRLLLEDVEQRHTLEVRCEGLRQARESLDAEIHRLDGHEMSLRPLERELAAAAAELEECRARVDEARLGEELDREKRINVRVIERAEPPVVPTGLSRNLKLAMGAFIGLLAGVGTALLIDVFRPW